ncbi:hypothetical protein EPA93_05675 [Ktedonosporobacter rubrisoli]|uniref:Uncharacterized protein n=1 Tax=Ktedonosporobacter rubrisoli TaxID=2509675 RepID=A0A4P6JK53_KTERU|nr:hypothetical protein [Ktedonosporobacter rubrisoli]QBD75519.1 hypothetical protein EPA93_05675 [Ktedonosporobacter rubrisoli]
MQASTPNSMANCVTIGEHNLIDMTMQVQMTILKGGCGGIGFRGNYDGSFYFFELCRDGSYTLRAFSPSNGSGKILAQGTSPAIRKEVGETNTVAITGKGSNIAGYVNAQQACHVIDGTDYNTYNNELGLRAIANANPTEVVFKDATVWRL